MTPLNAITETLVRRLDENLREAFEERAGIMQFEAGRPRELAECLALLDVLRDNPGALAGVTVLQVELEGETLFVLATNRDSARRHVQAIHGREIGTVPLAEAVDQCGSVALLTRTY